MICCSHLISPAVLPVTLVIAISIFAQAPAVCLCFFVSPLTLFSLAHIRSKGSPHLTPHPPPSLFLSLVRALSLPPLHSLSPSPSAESHSGSLDQTLQRSRQRKVLPGAQLTYLLCSCRLGQPRVSDTSFLLTAQHYFPKTFGNTLRRDSVFLEMLSNL